jgi:hypothetical protein
MRHFAEHSTQYPVKSVRRELGVVIFYSLGILKLSAVYTSIKKLTIKIFGYFFAALNQSIFKATNLGLLSGSKQSNFFFYVSKILNLFTIQPETVHIS